MRILVSAKNNEVVIKNLIFLGILWYFYECIYKLLIFLFSIADSGGLQEAFSAYKRYMKQLVSEDNTATILQDEKMPDLNLSPEQLFFLGFAQLWCAAYEEEHYWEELTDEHTMDKYRVLGAVTNNEDFAKAYECPVGSKMHTDNTKCKLW